MELDAEYRERGLVVMAISNEPLAKVAPYAEAYGLSFPVAAGSKTGSQLGAMVGQNGIPHSYLIDAEGNLAWHGHPTELTGKRIESLLRGVGTPGKKDELAWRGSVDGAPAAALELAAEGELAKALKLCSAEETAGAADLHKTLLGHVTELRGQVDAALARRDVRLGLRGLELLTKELEGEPIGEELATRLKEVEKDETVQNELSALDALERAFEIADKRGRKKAIKSFERIAEQYPQTRAAERATKYISGGR